MGPALRSVIAGDPDAPRWFLVGLFAGIVLLALGVGAMTALFHPTHPIRRTVRDIVLPVVLFVLPGLVTMIGGYRRCGLVSALVIGAMPLALFGLTALFGTTMTLPGMESGDGPHLVIFLAIGLVSVTVAVLGFVLGTAVEIVVSRDRS